MHLLAGLRDVIHQQGSDNTYWIAYSGGLDSHVLLSLCHQLTHEQSLSFRVIHINHGLSINAAHWAQHCEAICLQYQLPFEQVTIHLNSAHGDSLEELAREERYAVFAERLQNGDVLLTAHHQDDQAETVLLQLLRGAGVKGLSAMPGIKPFAQGFHARPLLGYKRNDILQYALSEKLQWIEDESNSNKNFSRNYLRHHIMPVLKQRWPATNAALSRSAAHCAETQILLAEYGLMLTENVKGRVAGTLSVSGLQTLTVLQQKLALRTWIESAGFPPPNVKKIDSILRDVLTADWDRVPCVAWGEVELRRHRDDVYIMQALSAHDVTQSLSAGRIEIRFRQGGETLELPGRGRQSLKNLFQEWNVVPWLRDRVPLVYVDGELVGVVIP